MILEREDVMKWMYDINNSINLFFKKWTNKLYRIYICNTWFLQ